MSTSGILIYTHIYEHTCMSTYMQTQTYILESKLSLSYSINHSASMSSVIY